MAKRISKDDLVRLIVKLRDNVFLSFVHDQEPGGVFSPAAIIIDSEGYCRMLAAPYGFKDARDKDEFSDAIEALAGPHTLAIIFTAEAWIMEPKTVEDLPTGPTFSISQHPKREEAVIFSVETAEGVTHYQWRIFHEGETRRLGDLETLEGAVRGRFTHLLKSPQRN